MKSEEAIIREKTPSPHSKLPALFKIIRLNGTRYRYLLSWKTVTICAIPVKYISAGVCRLKQAYLVFCKQSFKTWTVVLDEICLKRTQKILNLQQRDKPQLVGLHRCRIVALNCSLYYGLVLYLSYNHICSLSYFISLFLQITLAWSQGIG